MFLNHIRKIPNPQNFNSATCQRCYHGSVCLLREGPLISVLNDPEGFQSYSFFFCLCGETTPGLTNTDWQHWESHHRHHKVSKAVVTCAPEQAEATLAWTDLQPQKCQSKIFLIFLQTISKPFTRTRVGLFSNN